MVSNKYALVQKWFLYFHEPGPSIVSKGLDYFGIAVVAHAEEADSYLEKVAVIGLMPCKSSEELRGVQLMGQVARLQNH